MIFLTKIHEKYTSFSKTDENIFLYGLKYHCIVCDKTACGSKYYNYMVLSHGKLDNKPINKT